MTREIKTLELARIYESQGYCKEAFETYTFLDSHNPCDEVSAGLKRMKKRLEKPLENQTQNNEQNLNFDIEALKSDMQALGENIESSSTDQKISKKFEKWVTFMVLENRLNKLKILNDDKSGI